jgi:uncharacterized membrane protein YeaQ/YmgE (transglycosylase-associated protein family)
MESILINIVSGAVGGNLAGMVLKDFDSGWITKSIAGVVGGGIGGQIMTQLGIDPGQLASGGDWSSILSQVGGGGVGGGLALVVWGYVKKYLGQA